VIWTATGGILPYPISLRSRLQRACDGAASYNRQQAKQIVCPNVEEEERPVSRLEIAALEESAARLLEYRGAVRASQASTFVCFEKDLRFRSSLVPLATRTFCVLMMGVREVHQVHLLGLLLSGQRVRR
jgi:hypothetical protein